VQRDSVRAVKKQARDCPSQKLAVVGYSQGAHAVGDVFSKNVGG
jgi:predicted esterase